MSDTNIVLLTLIAYKLVLLGVGWWASKRVSDEANYFLRRGLGAWTARLSYAAVLSAVMSTVDSLLLEAASAVSNDSGIQYRSLKRTLFFGCIK